MSEKLTRTQQKNLERLGGVNPADQSFSRRQLLCQAGGTGLVLAGALGAGAMLRDRWGMEGIKPPPPVRLKDYSIKDVSPSRPSMVVVRFEWSVNSGFMATPGRPVGTHSFSLRRTSAAGFNCSNCATRVIRRLFSEGAGTAGATHSARRHAASRRPATSVSGADAVSSGEARPSAADAA